MLKKREKMASQRLHTGHQQKEKKNSGQPAWCLAKLRKKEESSQRPDCMRLGTKMSF